MLTPTEAKKVRTELGLSQKAVTAATGISNTDISKFENGKRVLPNDEAVILINFYREKGGDLPQDLTDPHSLEIEPDLEDIDQGDIEAVEQRLNATERMLPLRAGQRHIDGFLVPEGISPETAEALMNEYHSNKEIIIANLDKEVPRLFSMFGRGEIDHRFLLGRILIPMAENFAIIDRLQGNSSITRWETLNSIDASKDNRVETYKDAVEHLFTQVSDQRQIHLGEEL